MSGHQSGMPMLADVRGPPSSQGCGGNPVGEIEGEIKFHQRLLRCDPVRVLKYIVVFGSADLSHLRTDEVGPQPPAAQSRPPRQC